MATKKQVTKSRSSAQRAVSAKAAAAVKKPSRKPRAAQSAGASKPKKSAVGDVEVTIDRRRAPRRAAEVGTVTPAAVPALEKRQKVNRRRQIDPTTCERDYSTEEVEFMNALDEYKRKSGRMFPTCSEVLEVIRSLGYVKLSPAGQAALTAMPTDELECEPEAAL